MTASCQIRRATLADLDTVVAHRCAMFSDMGHTNPHWLRALAAACRPYFEKHLRANSYLAWFAQASDGSIAAGAGLLLIDWPPTVADLASARAMLLNVYTQPAHRRQGLARHLVLAALDWCRQNQISTINLHASKEGRPLYTSLGFQPTSEMRLHLNL